MSKKNSQLGPFDSGDETLIAEKIAAHFRDEGYHTTIEMYDNRSNWEEATNIYLATDNSRVRLSVFSPWYDTYIRVKVIIDDIELPLPKLFWNKDLVELDPTQFGRLCSDLSEYIFQIRKAEVVIVRFRTTITEWRLLTTEMQMKHRKTWWRIFQWVFANQSESERLSFQLLK